MPNWTNNFVEIIGSEERLKEIKETLYTNFKHSKRRLCF